MPHFHPIRILVLLVVVAAPLFGQGLRFTDVTASAGLNFQHVDPGPLMGSGAAFLDYDRDGHVDIFLTGGTNSCALYRNQGDGTFAEMTGPAGLLTVGTRTAFAMCVSVADIDADGWPDIFVGFEGPNRLWRNLGNGSFTEVTTPNLARQDFTSSAAFGDFDGDGDVDLYVGDYIETLNYPFHVPDPNHLYENDGTGVFSEVTATHGIGGAGTTLAVDWTDYDGDGDLDLMVANDFGAFVEPNRLYRNDGPNGVGGNGRFTEVSIAMGADIAVYCMGITMADYDRDGDLDGYFSNLGRNVLLRNDGALGFTDVTTASGTENTFDLTTGNPPLFATSWSVAFQDFDHDGWLDLHVSNGHIPAAPEIANGQFTPTALYHHQGASLQFVEVASSAGIDDPQIGRGSAFADYDGDGDIDVLQANANGVARLFRNDTVARGAWLQLSLQGRLSDRDAIGARVAATLPNQALLVREVDRNLGFESSSDPTVHFGLGAEARVQDLAIRWPSGVEQAWSELPASNRWEVVEPVLDITQGTSATQTVRPGERLQVQLDVENRGHAPVSGLQFVELWQGSSLFWRGRPTALAFGTAESRTLQFAIDIPAGLRVPSPTSYRLKWSIVDTAGGADQWQRDFTLAP